MKFKITLLVLSILFGSFLQVAIAQNLSVTGKVKSKANGDPLIGTTVSSKGTTNSVITDANGNFSITVQKGATLVFTYTGMALIEYKVNAAGFIEIQMEEANKKLVQV